MRTTTNRVLETVTGYEAAVKEMESCVSAFNECYGKGRMQFVSKSKLEARDAEGSGEFYLAVCTNINEAASCTEEIYEIQTAW